jgi:hypothetical protein
MGFLSLVSLFDVGMKATTLTGRSAAVSLTPASSDNVMPSLVDEEEVKERTLDSEQEEEEDEDKEQGEPAQQIQTLETTQSVTKSCSTEITATTMAAESKQSPSDSVQADPLGALATAALEEASAS